MVDSQSRLRLYGCHYNYNYPHKALKTLRDIHQRTAANNTRRLPPIDHDCRAGYLQQFSDSQDWRAYVFSHAMRQTTKSAKGLHQPPKVKIRPEKLLRSIGERGSKKGEFSYPRSLTSDSIGDLYIADSLNNRIQVFNGHGVFKFCIGDGDVKLQEPSGISVFPNDDLAIADRKSKTVKILNTDASLKFEIKTNDEPFSVVCDFAYNVIVSTYGGNLELYRRGGIFYNRFHIENCNSAAHIATNSKGEILVSNPDSRQIQFYKHTGELLYRFKPLSAQSGLTVENGGICVNDRDEIIICDSLNHCINVYTDRGVLLHQLISPTDDLGSVKACALGRQGHLAVVEYTTKGRHCLKVFRYRDCKCHLYQKSPIDDDDDDDDGS